MNGEVFNKCIHVCMYVNMESRKYILFRISITISCAVMAFVKIIVFLVIIILRDPLNSAINFDRTVCESKKGVLTDPVLRSNLKKMPGSRIF